MIKKEVPHLPGVYFFKNAQEEIIYVGKAKNLHKRISSYFQKKGLDWKIDSLLSEYVDIDWVITHTETEALLLEAQLISQYKPKFNVLLRDGQPFLYFLFTKEAIPKFLLVRTKKQKGSYFGPFFHKIPTRAAYNYLLKTFKINLCNKTIQHGCLDYHIGLCPGNCKPDFDINAYLFRLELVKELLQNKPKNFVKKIHEQIIIHNKNLEFEISKHLHEYAHNVDHIFHTLHTKFNDTKYADQVFAITSHGPTIPNNNYEGIAQELKKLLNLPIAPTTIDCFDISHFQSQSIVGSCVRFTNGIPDKNNLRRFKITTLDQQNDYAALQEIISRRYSNSPLPDLIVIDGGKGQLSAAQAILPDQACLVSLTKREETIYSSFIPEGVLLDIHKTTGQLLIALRDYAHHFAISYHRLHRKKELDK